LDNIKQRGEELPKLILFTDDSAINIYNLFKLEGLPKDFFYGISFMGVIYEPNGRPESGFYEAMEKINNEKQFKLIYPDDYIVEGPAMTEYQIMEYQLRRETKYGTPLEEGEKEEPVVLTKQKFERIMNIISGIGQNKKNLPKISETKFLEFLKIKGVPVDDSNVAKEGEFNKICEEVKQILIREGIFDPKKPEENVRHFLHMVEEGRGEEAREKIYNIYREFLPPVPSYDVEYDDPSKMRKSFALQNTKVADERGVANQTLIKPLEMADAGGEKFPWKAYLGAVGKRVLAKEYPDKPGSSTPFAAGTITAVFENPTNYEKLSSNQKKDVKESVRQCLEFFVAVPKFPENRVIAEKPKTRQITRELLIKELRRRYQEGSKYEDPSLFELLPQSADGKMGLTLIDRDTFSYLSNQYDQASVIRLLQEEGIDVGKQVVKKRETKTKVDPAIRIQEVKTLIQEMEGKEALNADEQTQLDGLKEELLKLEFASRLQLRGAPTKAVPEAADTKAIVAEASDTKAVIAEVRPLTDADREKYNTMKKMFPEPVVRQRMTRDGFSPTIIDAFIAEPPKGGKHTRKKRRPRKRRNTKRK
jgi:hypothetical protein